MTPDPNHPFDPFHPPFHYESDGQTIRDANGQWLLDMRGWGYLTGGGSGGLHIPTEEAARIQDRVARHLVQALNVELLARNPERQSYEPLVLTEVARGLVIPHVKRVLEDGEEWTAEFLCLPPGPVIEAVKEIPGVECIDGNGAYSTNGWQYDWTYKLRYNGREYVLGGCGYYGGLFFAAENDDE